jgi:hypothetical protein
MSNGKLLLEVKNLVTEFKTDGGIVKARERHQFYT